jgi:hypothetical protein
VGQTQDAGLTAATVRERLDATADIVAASWPVLLAIVVLMVVAAALLWRRTQPQS